MKISPLAQGTGVPAASDIGNSGRTATPDRLERAKAIAQGLNVPQGTQDPQIERAQSAVKTIRMNTQQSTNRHETLEPQTEVLATEEIPISNTNEATLSPETEETKPLSPQFAALMKQKRALQVKERELAQREEALKTQSPAGDEALIAKLKANPLSVLQEAGVSYDQLTEAILNNQSSPIDPIKLRAEIKEDLKKELFGELNNRDQQAEQQVLADIDREANALVDQSGEDYEAIRLAGQKRSIRDLIHRTWKETGEIMDVKAAADLIENQLIEEALPFARTKKIQSRLTPAEAAQVVAQPPQPKPNTKIMRTLTNRDTATGQFLSRRERAIAAMNGSLKKG